MYVPVGGKQLINFMDDFNMPAKDTFGSQPPLELIRLWLDYGFWYDRLKQTVKYIKVSALAVFFDYFVLYIYDNVITVSRLLSSCPGLLEAWLALTRV